MAFPSRQLQALTVFAIVAGLFAFLLSRRSAEVHGDPLLVDDPATLIELERQGLSFDRVVGRDRLAQIARVLRSDLDEATRGQPANSPRRPFNPSWLDRGHFELVGVVNRIDRRHFDPSGCGEVRFVYRLALQNPQRPTTRLPLTINVRVPQPRPRADRDCAKVAARWLSRPNLRALVDELPPPAQIELDFQSVHVPAYRNDMDDSADYVLRSFAVRGRALEEDGLFNTPRPDADRRALLDWIATHLREIDDGSAVLPKEFLARRIVSVSPRGLTREQNRPFSKLVSAADLGGFDLGGLQLARTPELLLRRLDESTCAGCHQTRGVAGFHLLGEERNAGSFNTLSVGHSPHLGADLEWRRKDLASESRGERALPRPFAAHPTGELGSDCGLSAGLSAWTCKAGLVCRDIHHADVGVCAPRSGIDPGQPCEDVTMTANSRAEGPVVTPAPADATCPSPDKRQPKFCAPNWLGFTGGVCTEYCSKVGEILGGSICAPVPAAGYEADCFLSKEPIESCLARHLIDARLASCDASHPCRDDYGCARVPNAPPSIGACVPPYFIFQARVDGPRLDR